MEVTLQAEKELKKYLQEKDSNYIRIYVSGMG